MTVCGYTPQITSGGSGITPPPETLDTITRSETVSFTYEALTIELPAPQFGDQDQLEFDRVFRESRGLSLSVYRAPTWQKRNLLDLHFQALTDEEITDLFIFLQETLGKKITYVDYNSWEWEGVIVNPFNAVQVIRGSGCFNNFSLTFRGERV